jgi:hypothetical protein
MIEKNGDPKSNVLTSGSPVSNPKFALIKQCLSEIKIYFFNFTYPVRCFRVPPGVRVQQVGDHCPIQWVWGLSLVMQSVNENHNSEMEPPYIKRKLKKPKIIQHSELTTNE